MSKTPRTDAVYNKAIGTDYLTSDLIDLCNKLEIELKEMHATALEYAASSDKAHAELSKLNDVRCSTSVDRIDALAEQYRKRAEDARHNKKTVSQHNHLAGVAEAYEICAALLR